MESNNKMSKKTVSHQWQTLQPPNLNPFLSLQCGWIVRYLGFEIAFLNGQLDRPMLAELLQHMYEDHIRATKALRLKMGLYGPKDIAMIWNKTLFPEFEDNAL